MPVRTYVAYNNGSYNTPSEIITLGDSSKGISPGDDLIIYLDKKNLGSNRRTKVGLQYTTKLKASYKSCL